MYELVQILDVDHDAAMFECFQAFTGIGILPERGIECQFDGA
jgi:hypothetical protein